MEIWQNHTKKSSYIVRELRKSHGAAGAADLQDWNFDLEQVLTKESLSIIMEYNSAMVENSISLIFLW